MTARAARAVSRLQPLSGTQGRAVDGRAAENVDPDETIATVPSGKGEVVVAGHGPQQLGAHGCFGGGAGPGCPGLGKRHGRGRRCPAGAACRRRACRRRTPPAAPSLPVQKQHWRGDVRSVHVGVGGGPAGDGGGRDAYELGDGGRRRRGAHKAKSRQIRHIMPTARAEQELAHGCTPRRRLPQRHREYTDPLPFSAGGNAYGTSRPSGDGEGPDQATLNAADYRDGTWWASRSGRAADFEGRQALRKRQDRAPERY